MTNLIKSKINKYTKLLIRIDDVAENMNWKYMDKCEELFDQLKIKPLLGVIPLNKDPDLKKFERKDNFWEKVRSWQKKGWEITMHGCNHLYTQKSDKKDIFNYGGNSEFYGLEYSIQHEKIKSGLNEFKKKNINVRSFFAPNHIYDEDTLKALKNLKIEIVIDGYGLFPFTKKNILFIPQLFYKEIFLPFGIQSTQIHLNNWDDNYFINFKNFLIKYKDQITNLDYIINLKNENFFKLFLNYLVEKTLKTIRFFK
jgi:predicted deacetylase